MTCCAALLRADRRTILGAIIAGGKSSRFGGDKAVAQLHGRALIDHVVDRIAPQCAEMIVVGRAHDGLRSIPDQPAPDMGPLGGLAAALIEARNAGYLFVLAAPCDAFDLTEELSQRLYPGPSFVESLPVVGLWPASAADEALAFLQTDARHSMRAFAQRIGARAVQLPSDPANINTAADLERVERHGL